MRRGLLIWVLSAVSATALLSTSVFAISQDGYTLLEIKDSLNDSRGFLNNWRAFDADPCNWTGISCHLDDQRVRSIDLPYMQLKGFIPPGIGKLKRLQRLALHQNNLHGAIPTEIAECTDLRALYLRANYLEGNIPPELGNLSHLTILDLSSNSLRGSIPSTIGLLRQLQLLNLSTNLLSGEIPNIGVLNTFGNTSFTGNTDLCGQQIQKPCRNSLGFPVVLPHEEEGEPQVPKKRSSHNLNGVLIGAMSTMGLVLVVLLIFLWIGLLSKKERAAKKYKDVKKQVDQESSTKLVTFHGNLPYASFEVIEKLESLGEEDVVGSGGFGTVYKMVMNNCTAFAVKRIDRIHEVSDQVFDSELKILGTINHINLVNLQGYCRFPTSKFLIYDYMPLGSLDHLLHEHKGQPMNWNVRLRIALGSARGLAYLHHDCCPPIVHQDIKSSNILLDKNLEPHVSDFGLAKLLVDEEAHVTTVVAGTFGYLAPEYLNSGQVTEKSDVYSFGVLLLELVTGKRPTDPSFVKRGLNIVGWMNTLVREKRLADIVDRRCIDADVETILVLLDIARRCTNSNPDDRPSMKHVLQMLEEIMSPCPSELHESHSDDTSWEG